MTQKKQPKQIKRKTNKNSEDLSMLDVIEFFRREISDTRSVTSEIVKQARRTTVTTNVNVKSKVSSW